MAESDVPCQVCGEVVPGMTCYDCAWIVQPAGTWTPDNTAVSDGGASPVRGRGLENVPKPAHPMYRAIADRFIEVADQPAQAARPFSDAPDLSPGFEDLRGTCPPERALAEAGYHPWNVGISVTSPQTWKRKRSTLDEYGSDVQLYDYLVRDATGCALEFWRAYNGVGDHEQFLEDAIEGDYQSSPKNVAQSFRWARDTITAPRHLGTHQAGLLEFQ
jgi:hypothetical protein